MEIRCAQPFGSGSIRYGLLGVFDTEQGRGLQSGLTRMPLEIQQQDQKRLSGSS